MNVSKRAVVAGGILFVVLVITPFAASSEPRKISISPDGTVTRVTQSGKKAASTTEGATTTNGTTTTTGTTATRTDLTSQTSSTNVASGYVSTVAPTYTPAELSWAWGTWRVNFGATRYAGMEHSIQRSSSWNKVRFEVRRDDPPKESDIEKRRAELSGKVAGDNTRLLNGVSLWGGFSTIHHSWADPEGMKSTWGGVYGQIHMGLPGGSPALAFRRKHNGRFSISTRSEFETASVTRYESDLSWNAPHDIVYNVILHPTNGRLKVWVDGRMVVDYTGGIGHSAGDHFWNFGVYFPKNVTSPAIAEYANHVYPSTTSLSTRITTRPAWPN
jgi:hypothetical protein